MHSILLLLSTHRHGKLVAILDNKVPHASNLICIIIRQDERFFSCMQCTGDTMKLLHYVILWQYPVYVS